MIIERSKLVFGVILFFFYHLSIAQVNNYWQLGTLAFDFSNVPPVASNTNISDDGDYAYTSHYGYSTMSDSNGDLLFYTDGINIWNQNHSKILDNPFYYALEMDSAKIKQNVLSVPHPGDANKYFVFSFINIEYLCGGCAHGHYGIGLVDFSNNVNGDFTLIKDQIDPGVWNKDRRGAMTAIYVESGNYYWVILRKLGKLWSIKVDSNGVSDNVIESTINYSDYSPVQDYETIKFTPEGDKLIGIGYNGRNTIYKMNFNKQTGEFNNYVSYNLGDYVNLTDFEISNNSQNVYIVKNGSIVVKNINSLGGSERVVKINNSTNDSEDMLFLEKDPNHEILVASNFNYYDYNKYLHKIENQNSYYNSTLLLNYVYLNGKNLKYLDGKLGFLPQTISDSPCPANSIREDDVQAGQIDFQSTFNTIIATNVITANATAEYDAGSSVILKPGFYAKEGADFLAYIDGCSSNEDRARGITIPRKSKSMTDCETTREINIYPNPVISEFTFESDVRMNNWYLMDINGNVKLKGALGENKLKSSLINMEQFNTGNYFLKVIFEDQKMLTKSIIKK